MVISLKSWRPSGRVHGRWGWIHTAWVTSVWVTSLFQCTAVRLSISPDVVTAAVGDTVTLTVRYKGRFRYVTWYGGGEIRADDFILDLFRSGPPTYGPKYTGREALLPDGSLRITDVQINHTGSYTVRMFVESEGLQYASAQLKVHAPEAGGNNIRTSTPMIISIPERATEAGGNNIRTSTPMIVSIPERVTKAGGNNIRTSTPMVVSIPERGAPPASDASCTSWWVTLAVASGMLLGAVVAVFGVVLFYERRAKKANGATPGGSSRVIYEPAVNYENVENRNRTQTAVQSPHADHTYMALKHGDQATYDHLQRPQN